MNSLPHVLILSDVDGEQEFEVEHHPDCPVKVVEWLDDPVFGPGGKYEDYDCVVAWEMEGSGIDCAATKDGVDARDLQPGRYVIEGWYQESYSTWYGCVEAEGGITILGLEQAVSRVTR